MIIWEWGEILTPFFVGAYMLEKVKKALRVLSNAYDDELLGLIEAAKLDMRVAGIDAFDNEDELIDVAIITYCKTRFGNPENYDRLKLAYDEMKRQLKINSFYRYEP